MQVDGVPIGREELAVLMADIEPHVTALDRARPADAIGVTFFEIATALGFLHFQRRRVDAVVLEVGLGGRFDSTNVCRPALAIITSISLDHTEQLGNNVASIAREKAGIVKHGRPTISGATDPEASAVIQEICRRRGSALKELGTDFHYNHVPGQVDGDATLLPRVEIQTARRRWPTMELCLLGEHQAANAALVVAAVEQLGRQGMHISDTAVARGLLGVQWPARLEVMCDRPLVVLDCAHNVASIEALIDTLKISFLPSRAGANNGAAPSGRRLLVFAVSGDKDVAGIVHLLAPHFSHAFLTRYAHGSRSVPPEQLLELWRRSSDRPATVHATASEAWQAARAAAGPDDLICVTGSVFLAGELRPQLLDCFEENHESTKDERTKKGR